MTLTARGRADTPPAIVSIPLTLEQNGYEACRGSLRWDFRDPWTVTLVIADRPTDVLWILGWELLTESLTAAAGIGDVRIGPAPDSVGQHEITISSPGGEATFYTSGDRVRVFVDLVAPRWHAAVKEADARAGKELLNFVPAHPEPDLLCRCCPNGRAR